MSAGKCWHWWSLPGMRHPTQAAMTESRLVQAASFAGLVVRNISCGTLRDLWAPLLVLVLSAGAAACGAWRLAWKGQRCVQEWLVAVLRLHEHQAHSVGQMGLWCNVGTRHVLLNQVLPGCGTSGVKQEQVEWGAETLDHFKLCGPAGARRWQRACCGRRTTASGPICWRTTPGLGAGARWRAQFRRPPH